MTSVLHPNDRSSRVWSTNWISRQGRSRGLESREESAIRVGNNRVRRCQGDPDIVARLDRPATRCTPRGSSFSWSNRAEIESRETRKRWSNSGRSVSFPRSVYASWRVVLAVQWNCSRLCRDHAPHGALVPTLGPEAGASADTAWTPRFWHPESWIALACPATGHLRPGTAKGKDWFFVVSSLPSYLSLCLFAEALLLYRSGQLPSVNLRRFLPFFRRDELTSGSRYRFFVLSFVLKKRARCCSFM